MDAFEIKLRGFHAKAVQNIMARTTGFKRLDTKEKSAKNKGDNITTYLRKFQIDRENLNLAKRILLCESEHNHKFYKKEWEKTKNFLRVRSNFKKTLSNQQPRIFKFQPILGRGNCLVTLSFTKFESSPIYFRPDNEYSLKVLVKHNAIVPTNANFTINNLGNNEMSFYVPSTLKKKKLTCKVVQMKQNEIYDKGKMQINLGDQNEQNIQMINKQGKVIAVLGVQIHKQSKKKKQNEDPSKSANLEDNYFQNSQQSGEQ